MTAQVEKKEIGNLILEGIPEIPKTVSEKLTQYQNTREAKVIGWLDRGNSILISTRFGDSAQLHRVSHPGGAREQVTFFNEPVFNAWVCPEDSRNSLVFLRDRGGNENYQLYYLKLDNGQYELVSDGESRNDHAVWNNQGNCVAYCSTRRNNTDHDIYLCWPTQDRADECLLVREGYWYPIQWSPDDKYILLGNFKSITESFLSILNIETGEVTPLNLSDQQSSCKWGIWSKTSEGIFFTSDENSQFSHLIYLDRVSGNKRNLTKQIPWDVEDISLSPDGKLLAFSTNENGTCKLYLLNTESFDYQQVENIPLGRINGLKWHPDGQQLALTLNTPVSPSDVFVWHLTKKELVRWTFSEVGGLNPDHFIMPDLIHYETFDEVNGESRQIPAYYYQPKERTEPYPVLIYIHGGPESQYRPDFLPVFQYYLLELGVAIVAPNVRGSLGYGKDFLTLDNGYKREDSVKDIGSLLDWIETRPELDRERIAVMGGSYGGYMVLASMTHFNHRLCCGIDIVGISNFVTFLKNTKSYRRDLRRVEYGDERDPKMRKHLERISPTSNAHKITKPMLIVQGLNDPRVPASEAEQMLKAIRGNGGEAWYLLAKDEGHGFRKKNNRDYFAKAVIIFLQQYLLGKR